MVDCIPSFVVRPSSTFVDFADFLRCGRESRRRTTSEGTSYHSSIAADTSWGHLLTYYHTSAYLTYFLLPYFCYFYGVVG